MYGRDYHAHRYVELDQITPDNVGNLHPVWVFATGGANRGLEATPLLHEGVIYLSADESRVFAVDARTGGKLWGYDPEIGVEVERVFCCGSINRGVALFGDLVYVGTMDARLVALRQGHRRGGLGGRGRRLGARLQHHRRAAGGERDGPHRHGRRRVRGARLREGVRRRHRGAPLDDLHHPGAGRARERDLARRHLEERRRAHLDHRRLRSRAEPRLLEHRKRGPLELPGAEGRQPVDRGHHRHRRRRRVASAGASSTPPGTAGTTTRSAPPCSPTSPCPATGR